MLQNLYKESVSSFGIMTYICDLRILYDNKKTNEEAEVILPHFRLPNEPSAGHYLFVKDGAHVKCDSKTPERLYLGTVSDEPFKHEMDARWTGIEYKGRTVVALIRTLNDSNGSFFDPDQETDLERFEKFLKKHREGYVESRQGRLFS